MGDLEATANDLLGKLKSKQFFQSSWDTAAFVIFLTFIGECGFCLGLPPVLLGSPCVPPMDPLAWTVAPRYGAAAATAGFYSLLLLLLLPQSPVFSSQAGEANVGSLCEGEDRAQGKCAPTWTFCTSFAEELPGCGQLSHGALASQGPRPLCPCPVPQQQSTCLLCFDPMCNVCLGVRMGFSQGREAD